MQEQGIRTSVVRAVLAEQAHNPHAAYRAAAELNEIVKRETWPPLLDAYARSARITRDQPRFELEAARLALPEEKALLAAYEVAEIEAQLDRAGLSALSIEVVSDRHVIVWGRMAGS